MRIALVLLLLGLLLIQVPAAQEPAPATPAPKPTTMKELMLDLIYPASDALFYVDSDDVQSAVEWNRLSERALALSQAAVALTTPGQAWGGNGDQWKADAKLLLDVSLKAYRGAKARNLEAVQALNAELYESCQSCHVHYRPGYRRRP
jgi:hypothetical protein